ncbi:isochorismate synthase [Vagococcus sp. PNs007]|uniref:isochorismate synthase n=1 Tax=Vagococcus proximus TaxID=2991417 RepID=A0ABT5X034_9ENTE|nr:isochorismate synthase [Vagococcus proximus]MDF0479372.1 isochorismate synthase [Vagococcus proximus]
MMTLPDTLLIALNQGKTLFSWSQPIHSSLTPWTFLHHSQNLELDTRFYFQTPTQDHTIVAFDTLIAFTGNETTPNSLTIHLAQLKEKLYTNKMDGPILCGGLPFSQIHTEEPLWGDLADGYLFLPKFLIHTSKRGTDVTFNFQATNEEELNKAWAAAQGMLLDLTTLKFKTDSLPTTIKQEDVKPTEWLKLVDKTIDHLKSDNPLDKIVLARHLSLSAESDYPTHLILENLAKQQPNTYLFYLEKDGTTFLGATPERLLSADETTFQTVAVAGSTPRGKTEDDDLSLGNALLNDPKNRLEHQLVVDRLYKELSPLTTEFLTNDTVSLLKNRDIQHLYLPITAKRKENLSFIDAIYQLHPTPALGGEPKKLAMEWITDNEFIGRGLYGAPIGWLNLTQDIGEFAVAIRSGVFHDNQGLLYAGCGIISASNAQSEFEETAVKFQPMLRGVLTK